jgi:hypothetical protein
MRRLSADPGSVIDKMVGIAFADAAAVLLLDLRRVQPVAVLPAECADAVVPVSDAEMRTCAAARGDFRAMVAIAAQVGRDGLRGDFDDDVRRSTILFFTHDFDTLVAWMAYGHSDPCLPDALAAAPEGRILPFRHGVPVALNSPACFAAYLSCTLANASAPALLDFQRRTVDEGATLALLLAGHAVADGRATPAEAAAAVALPAYPLRWDAAGQRATFDLQVRRAGQPVQEHTIDFSGLTPATPTAAVVAIGH